GIGRIRNGLKQLSQQIFRWLEVTAIGTACPSFIFLRSPRSSCSTCVRQIILACPSAVPSFWIPTFSMIYRLNKQKFGVVLVVGSAPKLTKTGLLIVTLISRDSVSTTIGDQFLRRFQC